MPATVNYTSEPPRPPDGQHCLTRGAIYAYAANEGGFDDDSLGELAAEIEGEIELGLAAIVAGLHEKHGDRIASFAVET